MSISGDFHLQMSVSENGQPQKIGTATRVGELETGESGKTFASYSVKMQMPDGTERSYKVRVGFNDAKLREHVRKADSDGADLASVVDKIVDSMDAASIAKLSGYQITAKLDDPEHTKVKLKGGEQKTLGELAGSGGDLAALGSSASKVIEAFEQSNIGQLIKSSSEKHSKPPEKELKNPPTVGFKEVDSPGQDIDDLSSTSLYLLSLEVSEETPVQTPKTPKDEAAELRATHQPLPRYNDRSEKRKEFAKRSANFDSKHKITSTKESITNSTQLTSQLEARKELVGKHIKKAKKSHVASNLAKAVRHFDDLNGAIGRISIPSNGTDPASVASAVGLRTTLYKEARAKKQEIADEMIGKLKPGKKTQKMRSELLNSENQALRKDKNIKFIRRALAFELAKAFIDPSKYGADAQKMMDNLGKNPALREKVIASNSSLKFLIDKFQNELQNQQAKIKGAIEEYHSYANRLKGLQDDIDRQENGSTPKQDEQLAIYQVQMDFFKEQLSFVLNDAQAMLNFGKGTEEHSQLELYVADLAHIVSSENPAEAAAEWRERNRTVQELMSGMQTSYQTGMGGDSGIPFLNELNPETVLNGHAALIIRDPDNKEQYEKLSKLVQDLVNAAKEHKEVLEKGYTKDSVKTEYQKEQEGSIPEDIQQAVKELRKVAQRVKTESENMQFSDTGSHQAGEMSQAQLAVKAGQFLRFLAPFNIE